MTKVDVEKVTKDAIAKGGILAILYFDLHGNNGEVLQNLGSGFVEKLLKEPGVIYAVGEIDEPMASADGKFYSSSVEVKILMKDFASMAMLCATYSPFSLEILKPDQVKLTIDQAHDVLMSMATTAFDYKKFIIERMSKKEDVEIYRKTLEQKIELGKRINEKDSKK
jgi:hypothetical protein